MIGIWGCIIDIVGNDSVNCPTADLSQSQSAIPLYTLVRGRPLPEPGPLAFLSLFHFPAPHTVTLSTPTRARARIYPSRAPLHYDPKQADTRPAAGRSPQPTRSSYYHLIHPRANRKPLSSGELPPSTDRSRPFVSPDRASASAMKLFMCFGGAAAVADDEAAAEAAARQRDHQKRGRSLSFRARSFLSGKKSSGKKKRGTMDADDFYRGVLGSSTASSVASSAPLSSAASLDSGYSSSSSTSSSARSSTASSSSQSTSRELLPPVAARRRAAKKVSSSFPTAGVAAVVLCLLMVVFCGRIGATLLTSMALYLFPRRWSARTSRVDGGVGSPERDAGEETTARSRRGRWLRIRGSCWGTPRSDTVAFFHFLFVRMRRKRFALTNCFSLQEFM